MSDRQLPSPMVLLQQSIDALMANPAGYLLAGLGPMLIVFPISFGLVFLAYGGIFLGMVPGLLLENEVVAILGSIGLFMVALFGATFLMVVLLAPLYASLMRSVDAAQRGQEVLGIGAPFAALGQDLPKVVAVYSATSSLGILGALMCYLPGILIAYLLHFAIPSVVLDRVGVVEAMQRSVRHVRGNPGWSAGVFAISMGIMIVISQIPILGYMVAAPLGFDFQIRAYRAAFADDISADR